MKKIFGLLVCFLFFGTSLAFSQPYILTQPQRTPDISVRTIVFDDTQKGLCYHKKTVKIRILMYHYVREDHRDPAGSIVAHNSISPALFEEHAKLFKQAEDTGTTSIIFMSELEKYIKSGCFPNNDITILTFDDGRRDNYGLMFPLLKKYGLKANLGVVYKYISQIDRIDPFMNLNEAQILLNSGNIEFQSHSYSHPDLTTLGYNNLYKEICTSKELIEQLFGISINTFIYPLGKSNLIANNLVRDCGYSFGLSTRHGEVSVREITSDPWRIQRIRIDKTVSLKDILE